MKLTPHSTKPSRWLPAVLATAIATALLGGVTAAPALAASEGVVDLTRPPSVTGAFFYYTDAEGLTKVDSAGSLIAIRLTDGTVVHTYCINKMVTVLDKMTAQETDWDEYALFRDNPVIGKKALWIVENSVPTQTVDSVIAATGIAGLTQQEIITATQYSIWHFTQNADFLTATPSNESSVRIKAAYAWFVAQADNPANLREQPTPSLDLEYTDAARIGGMLGPIVVETTATDIALTASPASIDLLNAAGDVVTTANDGDEIYIDATDLAVGDVVGVNAASPTAELRRGRIFRTFEGDVAGQDLITAQTVRTSVTASREMTLKNALSTPSISTEINKQQSLVGDVVKDTVVVSGLQPGATGTVTWKLLGPLAGGSADPSTADWSAAAVVAEGTFDVTENGTYTTPDVTIATEGVYTYTETIVGTDEDGTPFEFTSVPGLVEETTVAKTPCATNPSLPSDSPDCTEPTPEPAPVPCATNPDLPADSPDCTEPTPVPCATNPALPADSPDCGAPCATDPKLPAGSADCKPAVHEGGLAATGADAIVPVSIGALLLIALGATFVLRRKKTANQE